MYRFSFALLVGLALGAPAWADGLASLFDAQRHDFGNVPIGPMLNHSFTIKNTTSDTLQISNVHVSCGCVSASAQKSILAPGEQTTVYATMDTRRFTGSKSVTIYVDFTAPRRETVSLLVTAYGRTDIAMNPDQLAFGAVKKGSSPSASTNITFANGLRISEATADSGYVKMAVKEIKSPYGGTSYELVASLQPELPVGTWYTDVWVKTQDNNRIRIPLTVQVEPSLLAIPAAVNFDAVAANQKTTKSVVVKASQPFKILEIKGGEGEFEAVNVDHDSKAVHIVTIAFKPDKEGEIIRTLRILTDMKEENSIEVKVKGVGQ
ncbi:MAG TPA: DUF1573 domain-containing protein [Gemmataceae bacterium]|jgi:hypothetical protein|nr:DUF1573 domain-containing protein [Gemmataceae bacterium]